MELGKRLGRLAAECGRWAGKVRILEFEELS